MNIETIKNHHGFSKFDISSLRIFGSYCRSDWNENSDIDILCVSSLPKTEGEDLERLLKSLIGPMVSISFYKEERLRLMFENGHLFAWHIYRESIPLINTNDFISTLNCPNIYTEALNDIRHFIKILRGVSTALIEPNASFTFEAGVIYLCLRNMALAASWHLNTAPDFSKSSPYNLMIPSSKKITLSLAFYEELMFCRHASTRGVQKFLENKQQLQLAAQEAINWGHSLLDLIPKGKYNAN